MRSLRAILDFHYDAKKVCEIQKARVWENDPELKTVNLNNILNIPQELLEELMEALEENVYVTELTLVNTGILDKGTVEIFQNLLS